jgi:hypothetical protein
MADKVKDKNQKSVGFSFSVSSERPKTFDSEGLKKLKWTRVGDLTNSPEFNSKRRQKP